MIKGFNRLRLKFRQIFTRYTVAGGCYWLWLKLRKKDIRIEGRCNCCGRCCRSISLEGPNGWLRDKDEFTELRKNNPDYRRFVLIGQDDEGFLLFSCSWISQDNLCRNYRKRLPMCDRFPERSLFFCGGRLPDGCGFEVREVVPFSSHLRREMKKRK